MEQACDDIDAMFSDLLGEMDMLTQSLEVESLHPAVPPALNTDFSFAVGFKDLNESLSALEDTDLDALMADLVADINKVEVETSKGHNSALQDSALPPPPSEDVGVIASSIYIPAFPGSTAVNTGYFSEPLPPPPPLPRPPPDADILLPSKPSETLTQEEIEAKAKADKIKDALEKLKEAKVKKLVIKVHMNDESSKTLMVDERQPVREILDNLFEKTHCDCCVDWCLYEINPDLQIERFFEDHENLVEILLHWTRDSENKILFVEHKEKYAVFRNPQNYYLAKKGKGAEKDMKEKMKESLLEVSKVSQLG
uniref:Amyloid beta protein binding family B member 1 interacting protein n=1 Tax=Latimeria chalumnae TaxID=7897 RepID=M3XKU5_LATCH